MDTKELLRTTPETLAKEQHAALLKETQSTFSRLISHLTKGDFAAAREMLANSPAGDGHGCDNSFVSFDHVLGTDSGCSADIGDVVDRLEQLAVHLKPRADK